MLLAAMLAMVMVAAAPAVAQDVQYDNDTQVVLCAQIIGGSSVDQDAAAIDESAVAQEAGVSIEAVQNCIAAGEGAAVNVVTGEIVDGGDGADGEAATLPDTGGASLLALGAGALLVAGGLLARRIVR